MPASALATASYLFEPTLSLTGNCATSPLDEVPDPGPCPGTPGVDHPGEAFKNPSVTTDTWGDLYVANIIEEKARIDIFGPSGLFIGELQGLHDPQSIAVDSAGNLYVFESITATETKQVVRYTPSKYNPGSEEIKYGNPPLVVVTSASLPSGFSFETSIAVDAKDRLFVDYGVGVAIFKPAGEANEPLEKEAVKGLARSQSIAIDSKHGKIYVSDKKSVGPKSFVRVFELESPHNELGQITGSTTPKGEFLTLGGNLPIDVDDDTGHVFVGDLFVAKKVYEFAEDGTYLAMIEHSFEAVQSGEITVDDGPESPRPQTEGWLFVPSHSSPDHVFAFEPKEQGPPIVEEATISGITETEAVLDARINPEGLPTEYRLEYVTQQQFEEEGGKSFENEAATVAGEGTISKSAVGVDVSAPALALSPGTAYRFRAFAENEEGTDEGERAFETFEKAPPPPPCENESLRTGSSILLPDCRAYELVTPPDTNGRPPNGTGFAGAYFPTLEASSDGNRVSFYIEGGVLPGQEGTGSFNYDLYRAIRGNEGWTSEIAGPSGEEAVTSNPGGVSPDQAYSFWEDFTTSATTYIHFPDGHSELVGQGSLGSASKVEAKLITEGGSHIIFVSGVHLEPDAPPTGTTAVYDRSAEGPPTHVVSLLPGDETPQIGENAKYLGASEDGEGIVFSIGGTIYLRLHNAQTFKVAGPSAEFAGVAAGGSRVFYLEGGDLLAFDSEAGAEGETIEFSASGDVIPVNVAEDGTRAYFVSPSVLTGEPNPNGEEAEGGEENLYLSEEGAISFVGIVTERDVEGESTPVIELGGLGLWVKSLALPPLGVDPSRTTPTGTTLLFESRANLTGFDSGGFAQVYRYDSTQNRLDCLSCSPTGTPPSSDASLQSIAEKLGDAAPLSYWAKVPNQSSDGSRAFFQTAEPLVVGDTDNLQDVYEWEEDEVGTCEEVGGCVYLISGGNSASPDYLFAMSSSGDDVFFRTADILLPRDAESTLSLYDARVGGGFPEPKAPPPCEGEACHPLGFAPQLPAPTTSATGPSGNAAEGKKCPKGERKVMRHGRSVCVKKPHRKKQKHHRRAGAGKKGGSK